MGNSKEEDLINYLDELNDSCKKKVILLEMIDELLNQKEFRSLVIKYEKDHSS